MHRSVIGVCFAGVIGLAATLGAQAPTTTATQPPSDKSDREVTISGCLSKGATGFMLTNARVEPNASASTTTAPGATTTTAGSPTTTGTTGTAGEAAAAASPAMTWSLSGDSDLEKHVGHKIQVTGKTTWNGSPSARPSAGTTGTAATTTSGASADQPKLDVKSIKMVSTSCS
jgi:hypothetical protein